MLLRAARVFAFLDEFPDAMVNLRKAMEAAHGGCEGSTQVYCRDLLLKVLQQPGKNGAVEALEAYLALPGRSDGPMAMALLQAAVDKAAAMGAPVFAGNLMASASQAVEATHKEMLPDFLLKTAELYLSGLDRTRARVVGEYAETHLGRAKMVGPRWNAVLAQMQDTTPDPLVQARADVVAGEVTRDLTLAYVALARSTTARLAAERKTEQALDAP
jgi:hypothetical protein